MGNLSESEIDSSCSSSASESSDAEIGSTHYDWCRTQKDVRRAFRERLRYGIPMRIARSTCSRDLNNKANMIKKKTKKMFKASSMTPEDMYMKWMALLRELLPNQTIALFGKAGIRELKSANAVAADMKPKQSGRHYRYTYDPPKNTKSEEREVYIPLIFQH